MATGQASKVIQHFCRAVLLRDGAGLTDGQLLGCCIEQRDEAAFAALVNRHGPMVWGVCRRLLNHHDAEDAFQAAFLVLSRKAASILPREMVANWLYGVARQTALQARRTAARRKVRERQVTEMPEPGVFPQDLWDDLRPLLDRELGNLPDKYRVVIVLCDLEGKTRKEAALQLGSPEGTVAGRLARARAMLAKRLVRHGVVLSGGSLAALLVANAASACVPAAVASSTIKAATLLAAGQTAAAGAISAKVAALTDGVVKAMLLTKLKIATTVVLCAVAAAAVGAGLIACRTLAAEPADGQARTVKANTALAAPEKEPPAAPQGLKLTLSADRTETVMLRDGSNVEPIKLKYTFTNVGNEALTLDMSPETWYFGTDVTVTGPDAESVRSGQLPGTETPAAATPKDFLVLKPGDEWSRTVGFPVGKPPDSYLMGHYFRLLKPGEYHLQATYKPQNAKVVKGAWSEAVKSADFVLKVRAADDFGAEVKGLRAKVVLPKDKFTVGEAIEAKYVVKNVSKVEQVLWDCGFWLNHLILVHDADGEEPPLTEWGAQERKAFSPGGERKKNIAVTLAAAGEHTTDIAFLFGKDLGKIYDLSKPGRYTVQYIYEEKLGGWEGRLPSNEAAFEIVAKEEKPKEAKDDKTREIEGVVQEVDEKSILMTGGERVMLNEKTKYIVETGDDPTPAKRSDVTKGTRVAIGTKEQGGNPVALMVMITLVQPPKPKITFERVLWLEGKPGEKGHLYLVIPPLGGDFQKQMDALGTYAAAAVKEAENSPVKDPMVVLAIRTSEPSPFLPVPPYMMTGFEVKQLQNIAGAPPEKRGAKFSMATWTTTGLPKEAKPLKGAEKPGAKAQHESDYFKVEARGTLRVEEKIETDLEKIVDLQPTGASIRIGPAEKMTGWDLYLGSDKELLELARKLNGKTVVISGDLMPIMQGPPFVKTHIEKMIFWVTSLKAADAR